MKELNLEVGQKVWSIQLGDCEVLEIITDTQYPIVCQDRNGNMQEYKLNGNFDNEDFHPSLFESNPFEKSNNNKKGLTWRSPGLGENETGFLCERNKSIDFINLEEPKENKADLINALINGFSAHLADKYNNPDDRITTINDLVYEKLKKLLESI